MRHRIPWIEELLSQWAGWVRDNARWQGWGSGIDRADESAGHLKRGPGSHSNPVLAELMAVLANRHGRYARVHEHVMGLPIRERQVLVARYCGRPVAVPDKVRQGNLSAHDQRRVCLLEYAWSGLLPWEDVAQDLGMNAEDVDAAHFCGKWRLEFRLLVDQSIRTGAFRPDGRVMDEPELVALRQRVRERAEYARAA